MTEQPRYVHAVLCDDIRMERDDKVSLMGIAGPDLLIDGPLPAALPRLVLAVWASEPGDERFEWMTFHLEGPGLGTASGDRIPADVLDGVEEARARGDRFMYFGAIRLPRIVIHGEGPMAVVARTAGGPLVAASVNIRLR